MTQNISRMVKSHPAIFVLMTVLIIVTAINVNIYTNNLSKGNKQPNDSFKVQGTLTIKVDGKIIYQNLNDVLYGTFGNDFACGVFLAPDACTGQSPLLQEVPIALSLSIGTSNPPSSDCYYNYLNANGYQPVISNRTTLNNPGNTGVVLSANWNPNATASITKVCLIDVDAFTSIIYPTLVAGLETFAAVTVQPGQTLSILWTFQWVSSGTF